jgi:hypothetical protein
MSRSRTQRDKSCTTFHITDPIAGHRSTHIGNDFTDGHRGMSRAVKGAKKFLNSRTRFHVKQEMKRALDSGPQDW